MIKEDKKMSKKEKLRCILVKMFEQPKVIEIEHNLSTLQNYVGGLIDIVEIEEDVDIIINDEGKLLGLSPNLVLYEAFSALPLTKIFSSEISF